MNLRQRTSRYGASVLFTASVTGVLLVVASMRAGFNPDFEIWLGGALVVVLLMHARLGFAYSKAQAELEMLHQLSSRCEEDPAESAKKVAPLYRLEKVSGISREDSEVLDRVRAAIEGGNVDLYLQPIVSLPQRKTRFYEAFSRLRAADGTVLKPSDYLDAAERANRVGVIDNLILLRSVQALRNLRNRDKQFSVFCNISPATLFDTDFFNHFTDYLEMNSDLSSRLVFEFTYPAIQMMHPKFEENLKSIAKRGYAFSIDHVHTLDADWQSLRAKNFRFVKAPATLLQAANAGDEAAIARIRGFRKRFADAGIDLIAEKIESENSMPEILELGIDFGQGNLFGPPRPAAAYIGAKAMPPKGSNEPAAALAKAS